MADFSALKQTIQAYIKQNGNEEITGNILQDVLLAMVTTMGDGAINTLTQSLQNEITARGNADTTLQGNIDTEATARGNADTALGGRIDGLQITVNSINTKLAEGYVYAGIATAATNPGTPTGKVFYIATAGGTYTNFSGLTVVHGITILKYNNSNWSQELIYAIDDEPTAGSANLVKSGGIMNVISSGDTDNSTVNGAVLEIYDPEGVLTTRGAQRFRLRTTTQSVAQFFVYDGNNNYIIAANLLSEYGKVCGVFEFVGAPGVYFYWKKPVVGNNIVVCDESGVTVNAERAASIELHPNIASYLLGKEVEDVQSAFDGVTDNYEFNKLVSEIYDPDGVLDNTGYVQLNNTANGYKQLFFYSGTPETGSRLLGVNIAEPGYEREQYIGRVLSFANVTIYIKDWDFDIPSGGNRRFFLTVNSDKTGNLYENRNIYNFTNSIGKSIQQDKTIAWYGTSIPAGDHTDKVSFRGFQITEVFCGMDTYQLIDNECLNNYPAMTGKLLGADVYNNSVGSSTIARKSSGSNLKYRTRAMAESVANICALISGCYDIDWDNHTFSRNLNNSYGVTTFLDMDDTWDRFMYSIKTALTSSYEISLVCRHLLSDSTLHTNYVQSIFGQYYNDYSKGINISELCAYLSDPDIFVFDYGKNDGIFTGDPDSSDPTTFYGGYNLVLKTLFMYKADARVCLVTDYVYNDGVRVEAQLNVAKYWELPIIDMTKTLPSLRSIGGKIRVQGFWRYNYVWRDSGFTWEESGSTFTSNNTLFSGKTLAAVKEIYDPQQVNGIWTWLAYPADVWLYDGLHPASDKDGRLNMIYATALASWLTNIGDFRNNP